MKHTENTPQDRRLDVSIEVMFDQNPNNIVKERLGKLVTNADTWTHDLQGFLVDVAGQFELDTED